MSDARSDTAAPRPGAADVGARPRPTTGPIADPAAFADVRGIGVVLVGLGAAVLVTAPLGPLLSDGVHWLPAASLAFAGALAALLGLGLGSLRPLAMSVTVEVSRCVTLLTVAFLAPPALFLALQSHPLALNFLARIAAVVAADFTVRRVLRRESVQRLFHGPWSAPRGRMSAWIRRALRRPGPWLTAAAGSAAAWAWLHDLHHSGRGETGLDYFAVPLGLLVGLVFSIRPVTAGAESRAGH